MPSDNPTLADLAASAERDAAAGVKPVLEWLACIGGERSRLMFIAFSVAVQRRSAPTDNPRIRSAWWTVEVGPHSSTYDQIFGSSAAAQLFAESLLRRATAVLHPAPEPHVAAAVAFAAKVLEAWSDLSITEENFPAAISEIVEAAKLGNRFPDRTGEDVERLQLTYLGQLLLASQTCGSPVEPATRDAKESDDAPTT